MMRCAFWEHNACGGWQLCFCKAHPIFSLGKALLKYTTKTDSGFTCSVEPHGGGITKSLGPMMFSTYPTSPTIKHELNQWPIMLLQ